MEQVEDYCIKLVRSGIVKVANVAGASVYFKPVGQTTHLRLLKEKLLEEVGEYLVSPSLSELADILEVVEALAAVDQGAGIKRLHFEQMRKRRERGGFMEGIAMYARTALPPSK